MKQLLYPGAPDVFTVVNNVNTNAEITVWTPASGKKFRLMGFILSCDVAGNLTFKDNTAGTTILIIPVQASVPVALPLGMIGILSAAANNVLTITGPSESHVYGTLMGAEESPNTSGFQPA